MTAPVWLAAAGDVTSPATFSGTPYHCLQAGLSAGVFEGGLRLGTVGRDWTLRRVLWNILQVLKTGRSGGYQYSQSFLERLWRQADLRGDCVSIVNFFQLYPDTVMNQPEMRHWFYIDQTLNQLFDYYGLAEIVPEGVRREAIRRERAQYQAADGVICHSEWAAKAVIRNHNVSSGKVHVVLAGANIDPDAVSRWEQGMPADSAKADRPLRLVFVGKDWRRKGLDRLLQAMRVAHGRGADIELLVIGVGPQDLPREIATVPNVTWGGVVDKRRSADRFIRLVASCDVGCLLSRAEAGGISLREFSRLGLPTIAPDTGGSPEYVVKGATHLVGPDAPDEVIADILTKLAIDPDLLARQRQAAWAARHETGWDRAVARLAPILGREA